MHCCNLTWLMICAFKLFLWGKFDKHVNLRMTERSQSKLKILWFQYNHILSAVDIE